MVGFEKSFYIHEGVWLDDEWPASLELDCSQFSTEVSVRCLSWSNNSGHLDRGHPPLSRDEHDRKEPPQSL